MGKIECSAQTTHKQVHQIKQQVLRAYCPNIYTVPLEKKSTYAFVAEYIVAKGCGPIAATEEIFMIAPFFFLNIPGRIIFVINVIEQTLTLIIFHIFSSENS